MAVLVLVFTVGSATGVSAAVAEESGACDEGCGGDGGSCCPLVCPRGVCAAHAVTAQVPDAVPVDRSVVGSSFSGPTAGPFATSSARCAIIDRVELYAAGEAGAALIGIRGATSSRPPPPRSAPPAPGSRSTSAPAGDGEPPPVVTP